MAGPVFRLKDVPADEAEDVRNLLADKDIEFYETSAGNWGVSMPALWLRDDSDWDRARALIDEYQQQRADGLHREPDTGEFKPGLLRVVVFTALALGVLYLSVGPFLDFGE